MSNSPCWLKSRISILSFFLALAAPSLSAQTVLPEGADSNATPAPAIAPTATPAAPAIAQLRPALAQVSATLSSLRIAHWKAPGDLRDATTTDVGSIQRDLAVTLPPMLDQAQGSGLLAPTFAVFRNIDALYDVLLRVAEVATLTGSSSEANQLEDARAALESARAQLAGSLLQSMTAQDTQLAQLRTRIVADPAPAVAPPPDPTVVDDGPVTTPKHRKKKTPPPQ